MHYVLGAKRVNLPDLFAGAATCIKHVRWTYTRALLNIAPGNVLPILMETKMKTTLQRFRFAQSFAVLPSSALVLAPHARRLSASITPPTFWVSLYHCPQECANNLPSRHIEAIPERETFHARRTILQRVAGKITDNTMKKNVEEVFLWKTVDAKIKSEEGSARV
jgi:hypothetical protein